MPSAPLDMISVADTTLTPFFFSSALYRALSYRFLANLSSFQTITISNSFLELSRIISWNCGRLSVLAEKARSM